MYLRWFSRRLHNRKSSKAQTSQCLTCPLQFGCLSIFVDQFLFHWCHRPALSKAEHCCSVGTQTEPEPIPPPSPTQQSTPRTVLITENCVKSTKIFHSSTVCNTLNRSAKVTSFRQCTQCPSPSVGVFAEWAAYAVEDVKGYALLDTGASRSVGGEKGSFRDPDLAAASRYEV